jgi:hypothetical protein
MDSFEELTSETPDISGSLTSETPDISGSLTSETPDISGSLETLKLEVVIKIYNRLRI